MLKRAFCARIHSKSERDESQLSSQSLMDINLFRVSSKRHKTIFRSEKGTMTPQAARLANHHFPCFSCL
jgi:hypothetical protein